MQDAQVTKPLPLSFQDLGVGKERIETENWVSQFSPATNGILVKLSVDHSVFLTLTDPGRVSMKKNLPGSLAATLISHDDRDYILRVEKSGHEVCTLKSSLKSYRCPA